MVTVLEAEAGYIRTGPNEEPRTMDIIAYALILLAVFAVIASIAGVESRDGFDNWHAGAWD